LTRTIGRVIRRLVFSLAAVLAAGCSDDPGGAGDDIGDTTVPVTSQDTTTTTTVTTVPSTTITVPTFHVTGRVVDPGGSPVARAFVTMGETRSVTGPDGWFSFQVTEPGSMEVSKPGWGSAEVAWAPETVRYEATITPVTIRGVRVSAESAQSDAAFDDLLELAESTAVNALVFDTKQEGGKVLHDTSVQDAHDIGAVEVFYDAAARVAQAHERGLYTITRIVTFEDAERADAFPDEKLAGPWLDPTSATAREYNLALAEEACELGFDEIQFDYVRYPTGRAAEVSGQRDLTQEQRTSAIAAFLTEARERLHAKGCAVGAAVFGIVVSVPDDQGLGQRPEEVSAQVDTLSPMVYPSHYSNGWLGYDDPNDHPYDVTADAISDATPRLASGTTLRPYLQAFWWTNDQIRASIQAAEDAGIGWLLWNIASNFDVAALPTDAEVEGSAS